jgi:hypothetical protein
MTPHAALAAKLLAEVDVLRGERATCAKEAGAPVVPFECDLCEDALRREALLRDAASALSAMTWQPMETAPKDKPVLIFAKPLPPGSDHGTHRLVIAWWSDEASFRCETRPGWQVVECGDCYYSRAIEPPEALAWMPLPPAPKGDE